LQEILGSGLAEHELPPPQPSKRERKRDTKLATKMMLRPKITQLHHWFCVLLHFGSVTDFSTVRLGYTEVAKAAKMLRPTVVYILRKFVRDGY